MQIIMRSVGLLVTLGLIAVSVMMNFRFGQSLGRTEWDGLVYGMASGCADGFKVILPFAIAMAWRSSRILAATVGSALWLVFTAYSMTSSLGHSAANRSEVAGGKRHEIATYQDLRRALEVKQREREQLPAFRPVATVQAEIAATEQNRKWSWSKQCEQATTRDLRTFCEGYGRLRAELATAKRAAELDAEVAALRGKLEGAGAQGAGQESDAQVAILRDLLGFTDERVRLALTVMVSLMVELGSGLGLFVVFGQRAQVPSAGKIATNEATAKEKPHMDKPSSELAWRQQRVTEDGTAFESEIALFRDYCGFIVEQERGPALTLSDFREWLAREQVGVPSRKNGRHYYSGVRLRVSQPSESTAA